MKILDNFTYENGQTRNTKKKKKKTISPILIVNFPLLNKNANSPLMSMSNLLTCKISMEMFIWYQKKKKKLV